MTFDLQGRVALVTGGARGLGRAHARALAARGAAVVVADDGSTLDGAPGEPGAAAAVVDELVAGGGRAVACVADVGTEAGARTAVETALAEFGRLDALVANAGVLRDRSVARMTADDVDTVLRVHLAGSMYCVLQAWPALKESGSGRIVLTSSASGLYGNFGQANYAAAKSGMLGLGSTLALEGERYGIRANVIAPVARTRMTEPLMPPELLAGLDPARVSGLVAYLSSADCDESGSVFEIGGGLVARVRIVESDAVALPDPEDPAGDAAIVEAVAALAELPPGRAYPSSSAALARIMEAAGSVATP
ncbi:SDR family NAD(P)-dependent oxidoreductase [Pseudonocardia halophobica]|uniref:SDR family NAD(P)-dependent oxidoreductase n=1 Tax=Pseudonocardia halophobica TaxID=29401 RepID=UPI003D8D4CCF